MLRSAKLCWEGKNEHDMGKQRKKRGNGGYRDTANIFTVKITGFICVPVPTVLSLYLKHSSNVCIDPL